MWSIIILFHFVGIDALHPNKESSGNTKFWERVGTPKGVRYPFLIVLFYTLGMKKSKLYLLKTHPLLSFYLITFGLSWSVLLIAHFAFNDSLGVQWLGIIFPALTALVLTFALEGKSALEVLIRRLFIWRVHPALYALVLLLPVLWTIGTVMLNHVYAETNTYNLIVWLQSLPSSLPALLGLGLLFAVLIAGEEIGWRGYALPRLLSRYGVWKASILVGFFWGLWHIPAALDPTNVLNRAPLHLSIPLFILGTIEYSFIYTWLWQKTGGSLLIVCLFHGFYDVFNSYAASFYPFVITRYWLQLIVLLALLVLIYGIRTGGKMPGASEKQYDREGHHLNTQPPSDQVF